MAWIEGASIATRLRCGVCHHVSPVVFHVPDEMWLKAVPSYFQQTPMCLHCFASFADERMLPWDENIRFFPRSLATHIQHREEDSATDDFLAGLGGYTRSMTNGHIVKLLHDGQWAVIAPDGTRIISTWPTKEEAMRTIR